MRKECQMVADYLEEFGRRGALDVDTVGEHVAVCPDCYESMSQFFRVMEVPNADDEYLDESLDDLTGAIYNLVKALTRNPPSDATNRDNVRFVFEPGDPSQYVREGAEVLDEVEDFTGQTEVRGVGTEVVRNLIGGSQKYFAFAVSLLDKAIALGGRNALDCRNLKGILELTDENLAAARECFQAVIAVPSADLAARGVQVHAMNNLAYVHQLEKRLDEAVHWARRSRGLAEELGVEPFDSCFALVYFLLLRGAEDDRVQANEALARIKAIEGGVEEFHRCLEIDSNLEIKKIYNDSGLSISSP